MDESPRQLLRDACEAVADWINGAPCPDPAYFRSVINRLDALAESTSAAAIARDDLGQRLAWADDVDYFQVDRGQMPAPVLHLDDLHARRQARKRHPAGSRRT